MKGRTDSTDKPVMMFRIDRRSYRSSVSLGVHQPFHPIQPALALARHSLMTCGGRSQHVRVRSGPVSLLGGPVSVCRCGFLVHQHPLSSSDHSVHSLHISPNLHRFPQGGATCWRGYASCPRTANNMEDLQ